MFIPLIRLKDLHRTFKRQAKYMDLCLGKKKLGQSPFRQKTLR